MKMLERSTITYYAARLRKLNPASQPQWGSLTPGTLLPHLRCMFEISLEERSVPDVSVPLSKTFLFRWAAIYLPWPKGAKAPDTIFPPPENDFSVEREQLAAAMQRFVDALDRDPQRKTISPLLGPVPLRDWARIHGKHLDHHLRQFGC